METETEKRVKASSSSPLSLFLIRIVETIPSLILFLPPSSPFPTASYVAALHLHAENFVTQYTHIHLTTVLTSTTPQTPFHSPRQGAVTPLLLCNVFHSFSTSKANEAPIYAQFILQYTRSQNQLFESPPIPFSQVRTLQQFPWSRNQFASPFRHGRRSFRA